MSSCLEEQNIKNNNYNKTNNEALLVGKIKYWQVVGLWINVKLTVWGIN